MAESTTVAYTVGDAVQLQALDLQLVHKRLNSVPSSLSELTHLTGLDVSNNPISQLAVEDLPVSLKALTMSGCKLAGTLPRSLTALTSLEKLVLSANSIQQADVVFACPSLVHAGLAYNCISTLTCSSKGRTSSNTSSTSSTRSKVAATAPVPITPLVSLDLSHNDLADLQGVLQQLQQLPQLRVLCLKGNPISLLSAYRPAVLQQLPQLAYLDGQKLEPLRLVEKAAGGATSAAAAAGSPVASPAALPASTIAPPSGTATASQLAPASAAMSGLGQPSQANKQPVRSTAGAAAATDTAGGVAGALPVAAGCGDVGVAGGRVQQYIQLLLELKRLELLESPDDIFRAFADKDKQGQQQQQQDIRPAQDATASLKRMPSLTTSPGPTCAPELSSSGAAATGSGRAVGASCSGSSRGPSSNGGSNNCPSVGTGGLGSSCVSSDAATAPNAASLQPVRFHLELSGPDGASFCSTAVVVQPPQLPAAAEAATGGALAAGTGPSGSADTKAASTAKGGKPAHPDGKAAAASPGKARPGSCVRTSVKGAAAAAAAAADAAQAAGSAAAGVTACEMPALQPGMLKVLMQVPADVATRDWLRSGFTVNLVRTHYEPVNAQKQCPVELGTLALPAGANGAPAALAPASATGNMKESNSGSSSSSLQQAPAGACCTTQQLDDLANSYAMKQNVVATTRLAVPALVESAAARAGMRAAADGVAIFRPEAPLLHPVTHVRLSLSDARAMQQPAVAQCAYAVALHPPVAW